MHQFLFFVFQAVYTILANIIDDGFANKISIDAVIAYGSFVPITWAFSSVYNIGRYAYTNTQKEEKTCLVLGFCISIFMVLLGLPLHGLIHYMYKLTDVQISMFNKLIVCCLVTIPLRQIGDYLNLYLMYNFENKGVLIADILYWITAIGLDVFVYLGGYPVHYLVMTTGVAYFIYDIFLLYRSNILKKKVNWVFMKEAFLKGKDIVIDRVAGKIATLTYGAIAARLDSNLYAIHCVVYGVICNCEEFTNNFNMYCLARLSIMNKNIMHGARLLLKKFGVLLIIITYLFAYIFIIFYHGTVSLKGCLPWLALYETDCISLLFYETYKSVLSCYGKTEYLRNGGTIGILIRIPYVYLMYKLNLGLIGFGTACTLDFLARAIYFYIMIRKHEEGIKCQMKYS